MISSIFKQQTRACSLKLCVQHAIHPLPISCTLPSMSSVSAPSKLGFHIATTARVPHHRPAFVSTLVAPRISWSPPRSACWSSSAQVQQTAADNLHADIGVDGDVSARKWSAARKLLAALLIGGSAFAIAFYGFYQYFEWCISGVQFAYSVLAFLPGLTQRTLYTDQDLREKVIQQMNQLKSITDYKKLSVEHGSPQVTDEESEKENRQSERNSGEANAAGDAKFLHADSLEESASFHFRLRVTLRLFQLFVIWFPLLVRYPFLSPAAFASELERRCERSGPTFIKFAQWAATRADLFPESVTAMLSKLQTHVKPHDYLYTVTMLRAELETTVHDEKGKTVQVKVLSEEECPDKIAVEAALNAPLDPSVDLGYRLFVSKELLGSGSMGQVHHGTLHVIKKKTFSNAVDTSTPSVNQQSVAVKILHPFIRSTISIDLALFRVFAGVIDCAPGGWRWVALPRAVEQFAEFMNRNLDLYVEGKNLWRFQEHFHSRKRERARTFLRSISEHLAQRLMRSEDLTSTALQEAITCGFSQRVTFPQPFFPLVTSNILVEELANAIPLSFYLHRHDPALQDSSTHDPAVHNLSIARLGLQMFIRMMVDDNFMHSDLHPGNILVQPNCQKCTLLYQREKALKMIPTEKRHSIIQLKSALSALTIAPTLSSPPPFFHTVAAFCQSMLHSLKSFLFPADVVCPDLIVLDCGLVTELSPKDRSNFISLFSALIDGDGRLAARLMLQGAPENAIADVHAYEEEMNALVSSIPGLSVGETDIGVLLNELLDIIRRHRVMIEPNFSSLVISLMVVEGVGRALSPQLSLMLESLPILITNSEAREIIRNKASPALEKTLERKAKDFLSMQQKL